MSTDQTSQTAQAPLEVTDGVSVPGSTLSYEDQIAFVRRMLHFGVIPESLPIAAQETLGLNEDAALDLVRKALTEDDLEVIFPDQNQ